MQNFSQILLRVLAISAKKNLRGLYQPEGLYAIQLINYPLQQLDIHLALCSIRLTKADQLLNMPFSDQVILLSRPNLDVDLTRLTCASIDRPRCEKYNGVIISHLVQHCLSHVRQSIK